jgi:hypothetical protein
MSITVIYHAMSDCTVLVSLRRVIVYHNDVSCYVFDYSINITKNSDMSITVIWGRFDLGLI